MTVYPSVIAPRIIIRKCLSALSHCSQGLRSLNTRFYLQACSNVKIGHGFSVGHSCTIKATDGGSIVIGDGVSIGDDVKIIAKSGTIVVGNGVFIGDGARIVAQCQVSIAPKVMIAEYVVIRDHDHAVVEGRPSDTRFLVAPVEIGQGTWVGSKATVLKGVSISSNCTIGAHSLVRTDVPSGALAVGIPARIARRSDVKVT